jgi:hypothetical protein
VWWVIARKLAGYGNNGYVKTMAPESGTHCGDVVARKKKQKSKCSTQAFKLNSTVTGAR